MESDSRSLVGGEGTLEELMRERIRATIEAIVELLRPTVSEQTCNGYLQWRFRLRNRTLENPLRRIV